MADIALFPPYQWMFEEPSYVWQAIKHWYQARMAIHHLKSVGSFTILTKQVERLMVQSPARQYESEDFYSELVYYSLELAPSHTG